MLPATLAEAARRFGDRPAFVSIDVSDRPGPALSYPALDRLSDEVACGLSARGVRAGDVVALALPSCLAYPVCYLAAAKLGAVTAGLNLRLPPVQLRALIDVCEPRLVVTTEHGLDTGAADGVLLATDCNPLRQPGSAPPRIPDDPDAPVAIVFTSGTTGEPKGAVFGGRQLAAIRDIDVGATWGRGGAGLTGTSLAHLGFMTKLPGALQAGGVSYLTPRWDPAQALRLIERLRLSTVSGVPTQLARLLALPQLASHDLAGVRQVLIGGGPATPALVRAARAAFAVPVCTRYSCTEAGIGCATRPADPPEDAEETVGRPQPGVELSIRDPDGRPVRAAELGEVVLRSAATMVGYWRDPQASAAARTPDGFVRTGDLGFVDDRGRLHLAGRSKEMYVRGGYNVFPAMVEAALSDAPGVASLAVVPVPDAVFGEVGVAVVVPHPGAPVPTLAALRTHGADRLARHELPDRLLLAADLPLTPGDKLDRRALAARVATLTRMSVT